MPRQGTNLTGKCPVTAVIISTVLGAQAGAPDRLHYFFCVCVCVQIQGGDPSGTGKGKSLSLAPNVDSVALIM